MSFPLSFALASFGIALGKSLPASSFNRTSKKTACSPASGLAAASAIDFSQIDAHSDFGISDPHSYFGSYFLQVFNLSESSWRVHSLGCLLSVVFSLSNHRRFHWTNPFLLRCFISVLHSASTLLFSTFCPSQPPLRPLHFACLPIPLTSSSRFIPVSLCFGPFAFMFQAHLSMPFFLLLVCHPRRLLLPRAYLVPLLTSWPARLAFRLLLCLLTHISRR